MEPASSQFFAMQLNKSGQDKFALKAQNPTQGNEATGTKQPAPERLGVGNGPNWLLP